MPKYRILSAEELQHFEKEFVKFLVVNGIDADNWKQIQKEKPKEMDKFIELFSDVVFETIMRKTEYLVYVNNSQIYAFNYKEEKASLFIAQMGDVGELKLVDEKALIELVSDNCLNWAISYQEKEYKKSREEEIFQMVQSTCMIVGEDIYKHLEASYKQKSREAE